MKIEYRAHDGAHLTFYSGGSWAINGRAVCFDIMKGLYPVEFHALIAWQKVSRKGCSKIVQRIRSLGEKDLAAAIADSECEVKWGARERPLRREDLKQEKENG
jgi:hypothetical protein